MNYKKLVEQFLWNNEVIKGTYFFTAYYTTNPKSPRFIRHKLFNRALMEHGIEPILWTFIRKEKTIPKSSIIGVQPTERLSDIDNIDAIDYSSKEEKKTDVNLAVRLVEDAYEDRFDIAYILTCDTDIVPAVFLVKRKFPNKKLINLRIANSIGRDIRDLCHQCIEIGSKHIEYALMDEEIHTTNQWIIKMPDEWKDADNKLL